MKQPLRLIAAVRGCARPTLHFARISAALLLAVVSSAASAQTLTVYSAGPNNLITHLANGFKAHSGITVNVFQGTTGQIMARLEAERAKPVADVLISASWDSAESLKQSGDLLAYTPAGADQVPDFLRDTHYIAQGVSALALIWNRQSGTPAPEDWQDLARPAYRNAVTMPDPAQSGAAFELLTGLITAMGEDDAWALMGKLRDNQMIVPGPNARALNPVLQGAKSVVFGAVDYISLAQQAAGESIEVIFPRSGTVIAPRPMMILNYSSNQDSARAFLDYVLSEEGQRMVADVYLIPARSDVDGKRPGIDSLTLIDVDSDSMNARRDELLRRFRQVMGL